MLVGLGLVKWDGYSVVTVCLLLLGLIEFGCKSFAELLFIELKDESIG